jgi:predicted Zn-dependent protease
MSTLALHLAQVGQAHGASHQDPARATLETLYATGMWLRGQNRARDAMHVFRTMMMVDPTDERGWLALGRCHEDVGETDRASKLYALAQHACGRALRCRLAQAILVRSAGHHDVASREFAEIEQLARSVDDEQVAALAAWEGERT